MMRKSELNRYAELLVKTGVHLQKGQELIVNVSVEQRELAMAIVSQAYKVGAKKVTIEWTAQEEKKLRFRYQSEETLSTLEKWEIERWRFRSETLPARLYIESDDPDGLAGVDQKKVARANKNIYPLIKPFDDAMDNKYQWCIAGAAGEKWAKKIFPELPKKKAIAALWKAIFQTARMEGNAMENWKRHNETLAAKAAYLNSLHLKELRYRSKNGTDLKIGLIDQGIFIGGSETTLQSRIVFNPNIPSEEIFTSPKKGCAEGIVYASKPLSYRGEVIENFYFVFKEGKVVEVHAEKGEELLKEMISMDEAASYLGEVALIPFDSPINNTGLLFYSTLYDENASCHLALGEGFSNCIRDYDKYTPEEIKRMGINDSMIHTDFMIGTSDLSIVGTTADGKDIPIFKEGNWAF